MSKKQLAALFFYSLIYWTYGNGVLPLLPAYASQLGASSQLTGLYLSFSYLATTAGTIAGGWLSDRLDRRKAILVATGVLCIPPTYLLGVATTVWHRVLRGDTGRRPRG